MYIKKFVFIIVSLFIMINTSCTSSPKTGRTNLYKNFEELSRNEIENTDYKITVLERKTNKTILAIHGGDIDIHTTPISQAIAQDDLNLYLFEGIKKDTNHNLHITSHNFDEPKALALVAKSKQCVSVHGFRSEDNVLCMGGNDPELRTKIIDSLKQENFDFNIQSFCTGIEGINPRNIVNKCADHGVQLEFSTTLRKQLVANPELLNKVAKAVRRAIVPNDEK